MIFNPFSKKNSAIKNVFPAKFREIIANPDVQLVDVRTPQEHQARTIEGAMLIDIYAPDFMQQVGAKLTPERPVALFCQTGGRSSQAAHMLLRKGFTEIYNLQGGMMLWR